MCVHMYVCILLETLHGLCLILNVHTYMQAISEKTESHSQTQWLRPCNKSIQYISRELLEAEKEDISCDSGIQEFLNKVYPRYFTSLSRVYPRYELISR